MKITTFIFGVMLSAFSVSVVAQVNGAPGRVTGNNTPHGTFNFSTGFGTINCSGTTCNASSSNVSPSSQAVAGTLTFTPSHDLSANQGGSTGGGSALVQVSCDGGSTWNTFASASGSLPSTSLTPVYSGTSCTGPSNLNTLLFRQILSGSGASGYNMNMSGVSTVTITW